MGTRRNYSDFIEFAESHKSLTENKLLKAYKEAGGKGKRQSLQQVLRSTYGFEKGEKKLQALEAKMNKEKAKKYTYTPSPTSNKKEKKYKKPAIVIDENDRSQVRYISTKNPSVQMLVENIHKLYGFTGDTFVSVNVVCVDDGYSKVKPFSVLIPYSGRTRQGVKTTANVILKNLTSYYSNLAKKYSTPVTYSVNPLTEKMNQKQIKEYYAKLKNDMLTRIKVIKKEIRLAKNIDEADMKVIFEKNGVNIKDIEILKIV